MMMQHKGSFGGEGWDKVSDSGLARLARINEAEVARMRWLSMASHKIVQEYPNHARWICLRVMTGREKAVEKSLVGSEIEAMVPTRKGPEYRRRGRVIPPSDLPVLIGYALVRCVPSATAMAGLQTVEHVIGVLGGWVTPMPIGEEFINRYKSKAEAGEYDFGRPSIEVRKGQKVRIADGPLAGLIGTVVPEAAGKGGDVVIEVSIMGRLTPIVLPLAMLSIV